MIPYYSQRSRYFCSMARLFLHLKLHAMPRSSGEIPGFGGERTRGMNDLRQGPGLTQGWLELMLDRYPRLRTEPLSQHWYFCIHIGPSGRLTAWEDRTPPASCCMAERLEVFIFSGGQRRNEEPDRSDCFHSYCGIESSFGVQ